MPIAIKFIIIIKNAIIVVFITTKAFVVSLIIAMPFLLINLMTINPLALNYQKR